MAKSTFDQKEQRVDQQQNADSIYNVSQLERDPFEQEEIIHNASGAARTLVTLGNIGMIGGALAFFAGILLAGTEFVLIGFGVAVVGSVCSIIGNGMARNEAYKRRLKSRQK